MTRPPAARLSVTRLEPRDTPAVGYAAFGAAPGGLPLVEVDGPGGTAVARFLAFDQSFRGGVRAAVAELDGNLATVEVVAGAGPGGGPHVRAYRIDLLANNAVTRIADFFPFDAGFTGGVRVAAGALTGPDTRDDIVVAADAGGGPHVKVFEFTAGQFVVPARGPRASFFAFEPGFTGGVRVAAGELNGNLADGDELVVSAGRLGGPRVKVFRLDGAVLADYFAYRGDFRGGVNVAVTDLIGFGRLTVDARSDDPSQRSTTLNALAADPLALRTRFIVGGNLVGGLVGVGSQVIGSSGVSVGVGSSVGTTTITTATDAETLQRFGDPGPLTPLPLLLGPVFAGGLSGSSTPLFVSG